ncbi:hypothetical protein Aduo_019550 [Ancylostoma duodenale]
MLYAFTCTHWCAWICFFTTLIANSLLMVVVRRDSSSSANFQQFVPVLYASSVTNILVSTFYLISQPVMILHNGLLYTPLIGYVPSDYIVALILFDIYGCLVIFESILVPLVFIMRFFVVCRRRQFNLRQIYIAGACALTISLLASLSLAYFAIYTENLLQENCGNFRRVMQGFTNSEDPVFFIYKTTDATIKNPIMVLLLLFYVAFIGTFFLDRHVENYVRACQPQNRDSSYARTLQLSRAFGAAGFVTIVGAILPYSVLVACLVFEFNIGVYAIAIPLGSAFVPAMIPITIFYFNGRYRRAVFKLFLELRP